MSYSFAAGPKGQKWESFTFVSTGKKNSLDLAMLWSKIEVDLFETGGNWANGWDEVAKAIRDKCNTNKSKVAYLRLSCHGNDGIFIIGSTKFSVNNIDKWSPIVAQIAGYFVPGVSFVTIDACRVGRDNDILKAFSSALGGVDVKGYEEIQSKSTSEDNDRGASVTCRVEICNRVTPNN